MGFEACDAGVEEAVVLAGGLYGAHPPIRCVRTEPETVVEISADAAVEHGRWRHAVRFVRIRRDLDPAQVPMLGA